MKTSLKKLESELKRLRQLVFLDSLTGLYNRRGFFEEANKILKTLDWGEIQRRKKFFIKDIALVFLDLDDFKKINDLFGHQVGDRVLKKLGKVLKDSLRSIDIIGRWGGEEFVILLVGADENDALRIAEELRKKIPQRIFLRKKKEKFPLTASFGVVSFKKRKIGHDLDYLIRKADQAMYQAKKLGKNKVTLFYL